MQKLFCALILLFAAGCGREPLESKALALLRHRLGPHWHVIERLDAARSLTFKAPLGTISRAREPGSCLTWMGDQRVTKVGPPWKIEATKRLRKLLMTPATFRLQMLARDLFGSFKQGLLLRAGEDARCLEIDWKRGLLLFLAGHTTQREVRLLLSPWGLAALKALLHS